MQFLQTDSREPTRFNTFSLSEVPEGGDHPLRTLQEDHHEVHLPAMRIPGTELGVLHGNDRCDTEDHARKP